MRCICLQFINYLAVHNLLQVCSYNVALFYYLFVCFSDEKQEKLHQEKKKCDETKQRKKESR